MPMASEVRAARLGSCQIGAVYGRERGDRRAGPTPVCIPIGSDETSPSRMHGFWSIWVATDGGRGRTSGFMCDHEPTVSDARRVWRARLLMSTSCDDGGRPRVEGRHWSLKGTAVDP